MLSIVSNLIELQLFLIVFIFIIVIAFVHDCCFVDKFSVFLFYLCRMYVLVIRITFGVSPSQAHIHFVMRHIVVIKLRFSYEDETWHIVK